MSLIPKNYLTLFCLLLAGYSHSQTVSNINVQPAGDPCGLLDCNGQAAIYIDNGTAPFTVSLSNGDSYTTSYNYMIADSLCAGIYSYTVTDNLGATFSDGFEVELTSNVVIDSIETLKEIVCYGGINGVIAVHASGGEGPYSYQLDGITSQNGNVFQNVSSVGNVIVTDQNGCADTAGFFVLEALPISVSTTSQNSCGGTCNGSVSFSVSGATPPYAYSSDNGLTYQTGNSFTGLCASNYNMVVKDAEGCLNVANVNIIGGTPLTMSPTVTQQPTCNGVNDGSIAVNPSGGTPPYSVSIDGGPQQASMNFTNIPGGQHQLHLIDAMGCDIYMDVTLNASANFVYNYISNNSTSSCGGSNGSFQIDLAVGTGLSPPFFYSIDGGITVQAFSAFSGLSAGIYSLWVMDANGCLDSIYTSISDGPLTTQTDVSLDPTCSGSCDGAVQASPTSGLAPYTYYLDLDITPYSTGSFTGLCGGQHFVGIHDNNSCFAYEEINLTEIQPITFSTGTTNLTCSNGTGQITINSPTGGDGGPYQYSIDNGASFQAGAVFNGLIPGTYNPVVQDGNGCQGTQNVTLAAPANPLGISGTSSDVQCLGGNSGYIFISGTEGLSPYSYDLAGNVTTVGNYPNLLAGSYYFIITDANGCTIDTTITISQPSAAVQINSISIANPDCFGNLDGIVEVNASGGTPYLLYSVDNGATLFSFDSIPFLGSGNYNVHVEDVNGCAQSSSVSLIDPLAIIIDSMNVVPEMCFGDCNGLAEVTVNNGTTPYFITANSGNFAWTNLNHFVLDSICSGAINITAIDDSGCVSLFNFNISANSNLAIDTSNFIEANCFNDCDGITDVQISGGTQPYNLITSSGILSTIGPGQYQLDSVCEGSILLTVTDNLGCSENQVYIYTQPDSLYFIYNQTAIATCTACNDGAAEITIFGGMATYTVDWSPFTSTNIDTSATDLLGGTGLLCVTDANGCQFCDSVTVSFIDDIGFEDFKQEPYVYPNPSQGELWIELATIDGEMQLNVYGIDGKIVYSTIMNQSKQLIDLNELERGLYTIELIQNEAKFINKIRLF